MNKSLLTEIIISFILIILALVILNPFGWLMLDIMTMTAVVALLVIFAIFAIFIWRENVRDEREMLHLMLAGRLAFLAGSTILVLGIVVQGFNHQVDVWLVATLSIMILIKIAGLIYGRAKH